MGCDWKRKNLKTALMSMVVMASVFLPAFAIQADDPLMDLATFLAEIIQINVSIWRILYVLIEIGALVFVLLVLPVLVFQIGKWAISTVFKGGRKKK